MDITKSTKPKLVATKKFRWLLIGTILIVLGVAVLWVLTIRTQHQILEQDDHERVPYYEDTPR